MDNILAKSDELLTEIYKKINNGIALSDYENGIYKTLNWILSECDKDLKPELK